MEFGVFYGNIYKPRENIHIRSSVKNEQD